jgi:hypothetical protein
MRAVTRSIMFAFVLAACGSSTTVITESHVASPKPFARLAVFVSVPGGGFDRGIYHGFQRTMASELASCGVESQIIQGMPPKPGALRAAAASSDARLIVKARDSDLTTSSTADRFKHVDDEEDMDIPFWLELRDHNENRVTWQAFANVQTNRSGADAGDQLAHTIVARLRSDGVLRRCR